MLKRVGMVQKSIGTATLSLTMEAGQSCRVRDIFWHDPDNAAEDLKVKVDRKTLLHFSVPATWHLLSSNHQGTIGSMMEEFKKFGLFPEIPVAEGQVLTITGATANDFLELVYDLYEAGDIKSTDFNGTDSADYRMFQVISNSIAPTETGDEPLDASDLDPVFIDFPADKVVPPNTRILLRGLFGSPVSKGDGANQDQYSSHIKFLKDREDIFDKDLTGFLYRGDVSHTAASTIYAADASRLDKPIALNPARVIVFDDPIVFEAGAELNVLATIVETTGAADIAIGGIKLGMILDIHRV